MAGTAFQESNERGSLISAALALRAASREMSHEPKQFGSFYHFDVADQDYMWSQTWRNALDDSSQIALNAISIDTALLKPPFKKVAVAIRSLHELLPDDDSGESQETRAAFELILSEALYQWDDELQREERQGGRVNHYFRAKYRPIDGQLIEEFVNAVRRLGVTTATSLSTVDASDVSSGAVNQPVTLKDIAKYWRDLRVKTIKNRISRQRHSNPIPAHITEESNGELIWEYSALIPWLRGQWKKKYLPVEYAEFREELKRIHTD